MTPASSQKVFSYVALYTVDVTQAILNPNIYDTGKIVFVYVCI